VKRWPLQLYIPKPKKKEKNIHHFLFMVFPFFLFLLWQRKDFPLDININRKHLLQNFFIFPLLGMEIFLFSSFSSSRNVRVFYCGVLTLAEQPVPTKATLSLSLLIWTGEGKYSRRLMCWDKDRERSCIITVMGKTDSTSRKKII